MLINRLNNVRVKMQHAAIVTVVSSEVRTGVLEVVILLMVLE